MISVLLNLLRLVLRPMTLDVVSHSICSRAPETNVCSDAVGWIILFLLCSSSLTYSLNPMLPDSFFV